MRFVVVSSWLILVAILATSVSCSADVNWNIVDKSQLADEKFWIDDAQSTLQQKLKQVQNKGIAKNVIFFIGDGMSIDTVTAARIYDGQRRGVLGERNSLFFERFPHLGLSKTYCVDNQIADSSCTATAYLTGIKANYETTGVNAKVAKTDCAAENEPSNQLQSIASWALDAGKSAGLVTTTRVTHASPSALYAHSSYREYESDYDVLRFKNDPAVCRDIAQQLIDNEVPQQFKVIMGGGSCKFLPNGTLDHWGNSGQRLDGRNLIEEWLAVKPLEAAVVHTREQLLNLNLEQTSHVLGLFATGHLDYNLDNVDRQQPSLSNMTKTAIKILQNDNKGFFLFVEGGRIDIAHHETRAKKALDETLEFAQAIETAYQLTDPENTLIVVSADHGHTMTIAGYSEINNDILGLSSQLSDMDELPYTTIGYANGPVMHNFIDGNGLRVDLSGNEEIGEKNFQYHHGIPMVNETHDGGDVSIYASGPWSHLFTGVMEQSTLPWLMGYAACIGPGLHSCYDMDGNI